MMHKACHSIEEVPCCFSRSSIEFKGHTGCKNWRFESNLRLLDRSQLSNPSVLPCCCCHLRVRLTFSQRQCALKIQRQWTRSAYRVYPWNMLTASLHNIFVVVVISFSSRLHGIFQEPVSIQRPSTLFIGFPLWREDRCETVLSLWWIHIPIIRYLHVETPALIFFEVMSLEIVEMLIKSCKIHISVPEPDQCRHIMAYHQAIN